MSYEEAEAAVLDGNITDAKTIYTLFRARQPLAGRASTNRMTPIPAVIPEGSPVARTGEAVTSATFERRRTCSDCSGRELE